MRRILVADDDRTTRTILQRTLERSGFRVDTAPDGLAAWERLETDRPPFAILDWMMPGLDGIELCRRLRADRDGAYVYVLLLTATERRSGVVAGLDAGADDYLLKPVDLDELHARLRVGQRLLDALAHVRRLRGLLPICSYCHNVRTDADSWQQLEAYVSEHSDTEFSHGVCPSCMGKILGDLERKGSTS